jgi:hypothetical protein
VPLVFGHTSFDLASVGYTQQEFFVEGTADAYSPAAGTALATDGRWTVQPSSQAAYKTRIVVDRPTRSRDFNGTVVVEWLNVTGGADASPDWIHMHDELIRRGYAWVGVSAQAVGLNALKLPANGSPAFGDPVRYGSLTHPGDSYSYDMFSQAGQAVRDSTRTVLGGLHLRHLLGVGESQSAGRLVTYIDAVHPLVHVYDGFLVHSRGAAGAPLAQAPLTTVATPNPTLIRDDLHAPVLQFETETDLLGLGFVAARQPDTRRIRTAPPASRRPAPRRCSSWSTPTASCAVGSARQRSTPRWPPSAASARPGGRRSARSSGPPCPSRTSSSPGCTATTAGSSGPGARRPCRPSSPATSGPRTPSTSWSPAPSPTS